MIGAEENLFCKVKITKDVWTEFADMDRSELANAEDEQIKLMQAEKRVSGGERKNFSFGRVRMKICPEVFIFGRVSLVKEYGKISLS